jgi:hypothetical protein
MVEIPLDNRLVKFVKLVIFGVVSRVAFGSAWWPVKIKVVSGQVKIIDDIVKTSVKELTSICCQVDDTDLSKKNVKNVEILGFAWVKEAICCKSCMPVVKSDSEIAEPLSEPVAVNEVLGILDNTIDEVTEAANPELRLPAVKGSSIVSLSGGYELLHVSVAFETRKKQLKLQWSLESVQPIW